MAEESSAPAKKKAAAPKDKKPVARKPGKKLGMLYTLSGDRVERKNKHCPKCGKGIFMAKHKNRWVCGKCQYAEYSSNQ